MEDNTNKVEDAAMTPVPEDARQHWITPAMIMAGNEFCTPDLMVGATLIGAFGFKGMIPVVLFTFLVMTWIGNSLNGYMGAKYGLSSSVIARQSFGDKQARFIIALVVGVVSMGWWAIQTSVTGNALCAIIGIDYTHNRFAWAIATIVVGILFAIPSIMGITSIKIVDYIAVPGGLLLCFVGIYLALKNVGLSGILNSTGDGSMTFAAGVAAVIGLNVSQWVICADYTRFAKPKVLDNILIPWGIIACGIPLVIIGGMMAVGKGTADIVAVMQNLGFPVWGFIVLWLAAWTSQLVNNYTMGLSFANICNITSSRGRKIVTLVGTLLSIILSIMGILDHFTDLLSLAGLLYPGLAGVMFVDFYARKVKKWNDNVGWNYMATIAIICGVAVGYITTYVKPLGIAPLQAVIITALVYYIAMRIKAKVAPDKFTSGMFAIETSDNR